MLLVGKVVINAVTFPHFFISYWKGLNVVVTHAFKTSTSRVASCLSGLDKRSTPFMSVGEESDKICFWAICRLLTSAIRVYLKHII